MKKSREEMAAHRTYASVAAGPQREKPLSVATALHSIVVSSKNEEETGEEVLNHIRKTVKAKEEGLRVDKIRKAKERKVIMGFEDRQELEKVKGKLLKEGKNLQVQEVKNKNPLVIIKDLLRCHTDEEIIEAIRAQNKQVLGQLDKEADRMEIRYRRKARNPLMVHVILQVSPQIWKRFTDTGALHIDVQRVRVEDQSPLVQCSRCLGYGHGRRFCHGSLDVCSHCGGSHLRTECPDWLAAATPTCCNCQKAKFTDTGHNAFSENCP
ncbi:hypothetical protein O3G_MSEX000433, partial [Manduca sexta]